jgi:hypothetical protein
MSTTEPVKRTSRRTRPGKGASEDSTENKAGQLENTMAEQEKSTGNGGQAKAATAEKGEVTALSVKSSDQKEKSGAIEISPSGSVWNRPVAPDSLDIIESISVAGLRPIAASNMKIFGTILNNRPIMASNLRIVESNALADHRPIFASEMIIRDDLTLPGGRPIMASDPRLLEASLLPGGRPIASNDIDDPEALMGFID